MKLFGWQIDKPFRIITVDNVKKVTLDFLIAFFFFLLDE